MDRSATDPVEAVTEATARGEIADFFADIRASLGVPVVNLIWRHLATIPGALPWAWQSVRPLYASGAMSAQGRALRESLKPEPDAPPLSLDLQVAGLSETDQQAIFMILNSYEISNAMNLIALSALLARLDGVEPVGLPATTIAPALDSSQPEVVRGRLPSLLSLSEMPADVRRLVGSINQLGGRDEILPSMYRHLAHWPAFLSLIRALIADQVSQNKLDVLIARAISQSHQRALAISGGLATPGQALQTTETAKVRSALVRFLHGPLAKMTVIVALINHARGYSSENPIVRV